MKISKQKIELIMARLGINTVQFAERSGVSRQSLSTIKSRGTCTPQTAAKICAGLNCDVEDIIEQEV